MRRMKLFNMVEYLRSVDFYHDTFDIEDVGVAEILMEYDIYDEFTEQELQELRKDLHEMAEKNEFREAIAIAVNMGNEEVMEI